MFLSLVLFGLGVVSLIIENSLYQYINNNGVLHESMFLPSGILVFLLV
ncbi:MAG: DUF3955 domain-containing protein [Colwellia sp.]|nr:DUF3955 domain-containing protein [Colwellia sp.]